MKTNFSTRKFKGGAYATVLSAVVIAIIIVINLIVNRLNITFDLTSDGKYSLTEDTLAMLDTLEDDITLYYLAPSGESYDWFDKIFAQYTKHCDNIRLVQKDPVMNPRFAAQYTDETVEKFSVIVVNETNGRSRYVACSDMLITEYSFNYSSYQYESSLTGLDVEGQINSAIGYVTMEHLPTVYEVTGHGEQQLGTETVSMLEKANMVVKSGADALTLLTLTELPDDCDVLFIQTPKNDYTEEEVALLSDYMQAGGKVIFALSYLDSEHPNLMGLLNSYGIELTDGILLEENSNYYMQAPYILVPTAVSNEFTTNVYLSKYVLAQTASGLLKNEEVKDSLEFTGILTTSSSAYSKPVDFTSFYKEDGDPSGKFYLGLYVNDTETNAEAVVFSSYFLFNDSFANNSSFGNINLLINSINVLADMEATTTAVRTISLTDEETLIVTDAQLNLIGLIVVILLPLAILVTGIVHVVYRRKHS
ncbi:MAG: Gldg family protein [Lachnospiraceae bacterium]